MLFEGYRDSREIWIAARADGLLGNGKIDNLFRPGAATGPIEFRGSGGVKAWYSQMPDGQPIQAYNQDISGKVDDISISPPVLRTPKRLHSLQEPPTRAAWLGSSTPWWCLSRRCGHGLGWVRRGSMPVVADGAGGDRSRKPREGDEMSLTDAFLLDPYPFEVWIAVRTDGAKGSGTLGDPYDGSTAAKFDARMSELAANARVHLGPGEFQTNGYADGVSAGWQVKQC